MKLVSDKNLPLGLALINFKIHIDKKSLWDYNIEYIIIRKSSYA